MVTGVTKVHGSKILYQQMNSSLGVQGRWALCYPEKEEHVAVRHMKQIHVIRGYTFEVVLRLGFSYNCLGNQKLSAYFRPQCAGFGWVLPNYSVYDLEPLPPSWPEILQP